MLWKPIGIPAATVSQEPKDVNVAVIANKQVPKRNPKKMLRLLRRTRSLQNRSIHKRNTPTMDWKTHQLCGPMNPDLGVDYFAEKVDGGFHTKWYLLCPHCVLFHIDIDDRRGPENDPNRIQVCPVGIEDLEEWKATLEMYRHAKATGNRFFISIRQKK